VTETRVVVDADRARRGVALVFVLNGLCFASLVSRLPDLRADLSLSNGGLGLLLLSIAAGSVLALPSSGWLIDRWSAAAVVRAGALLVAVGLQVVHLGTVLVAAKQIQRASDTYGPLGAAFTILVWLFVISRVIIASAMLGAALWQRQAR